MSTSEETVILETGRGTIAQILDALLIYHNGTKIYGPWEHIADQTEEHAFYRCQRRRLQGKSSGMLVGDLLEDLRKGSNRVTYGIGLRWFLSGPMRIYFKYEPIRDGMYIIPNDPVVIDGRPYVIKIIRGFDGPVLYFVGLDLEKPFPNEDFLTAWELVRTPYG